MYLSLSTHILLKRIDLYGQIIVLVLAFFITIAFTDLLGTSFSMAILAHSCWQVINSIINFIISKKGTRSKSRWYYDLYLSICLYLFVLALICFAFNAGGVLVFIAIIPGILSPIIAMLYFLLVRQELNELLHLILVCNEDPLVRRL